MSELSLTLSDSTVWTATLQPAPAVLYDGYRAKHRSEGGNMHEWGRPAVVPSVNAQPIEFTEAMQRLSFDLNKFNPNFTANKWTSVYNTTTAFTNNQGFGESPDRRNYIKGTNLTGEYPKLMKAIIMCGSFYRGVARGDKLVMSPGFHAIDVNKPMPTVDEVLARNWCFHAVEADQNVVTNFAQGGGEPVLIPYFLRVPVEYELKWFQVWSSAEPPDPKRKYL